MTGNTTEQEQQKYARHAGFWYIFALVTAVFGNFFVRSKFMDSKSAQTTAENIIANEGLFRLGLVTELIGLAAIVPLAVSLYIVLKQVNRNTSLLALLWMVAEAALYAMTLICSFVVLLIILDDAEYLTAFDTEHRHAIALFASKAFYYIYDIGMVFFGLSSTVFCYLFYKSGYIPKILAGFGVFASLSAFAGVIAITLFPNLIPTLGLTSVAPIFLYEFVVGCWLLFFDLNLK